MQIIEGLFIGCLCQYLAGNLFNYQTLERALSQVIYQKVYTTANIFFRKNKKFFTARIYLTGSGKNGIVKIVWRLFVSHIKAAGC
jgi:hypothetical protein